MKKLLFVFAVTILAFACSQNVGDDKKDSAASCKNDPNPNGSSELALLMREMAAWTDSCRSAMNSNRALPAIPVKLSTIHSAKKTDETINKDVFDSYATMYVDHVNEFFNSHGGDWVDNYNVMVNTCVSCHENFCHGPIKRIQKLLIPTK